MKQLEYNLYTKKELRFKNGKFKILCVSDFHRRVNYDGYCDDDLRGGRVVEVDENDPWNVKTYMVRSEEFVSDYPGKEMRIYKQKA